MKDIEMMKCSEIMDELLDAAKKAGEIMRKARVDSSSVTEKEGRANFVTVYDEKVQEYLFDRLAAALPQAHFVGEEEGREIFLPEYETGYTFVVDPIDGTSNFMRGYDISVTSIGLLKDGKPWIGVVYNPYSDQMFWAEKGKGAYENGKHLNGNLTPLKYSLVNVGTAPYYDEKTRRSAFDLAFWYMQRSLDIRRSGSAEWDFCLVASGRTGLFFEPVLSLWDFTAGAVLVQETGGRVTDLKGNELTYRGKSSICAVTQGVATENYLPPAEMLK